MSKNIAVNNSLAKDHAERIRRSVTKLGNTSLGKSQHVHSEGYTAIKDAEICYKTLSNIVPHLQQKLEQDCANIARVADVWKKEDKEIAIQFTLSYENMRDREGII